MPPVMVAVSDYFISNAYGQPVIDCWPVCDLIQAGIEAIHLVWLPFLP